MMMLLLAFCYIFESPMQCMNRTRASMYNTVFERKRIVASSLTALQPTNCRFESKCHTAQFSLEQPHSPLP